MREIGVRELKALVAEGRLVAPTRALPERAPRLVKSRHSASSLVLEEREAEAEAREATTGIEPV